MTPSICRRACRAFVPLAVLLNPVLMLPLVAHDAKLLDSFTVTVNGNSEISEGSPLALALSGDGKVLAVASGVNAVTVWDVAAGKEKAKLDGHTDAVHGVAISDDGTLLATGSHDRSAKVWDLATGKVKATLKIEGQDRVNSVALSRDGKLLAAGTIPVVNLWDTTSGEMTGKFQTPPNWVIGIALSPDAKHLAQIHFKNRNAYLWDVPKGTNPLKTLEDQSTAVCVVAFSGDSKWLAWGGFDAKVTLWDVQNGKKAAELKGQEGIIGSLAFSGDGKLIACGVQKRAVWVWDVTASKVVAKVDHPSARALSFSRDGTRLASGDLTGTIKLWSIAPTK